MTTASDRAPRIIAWYDSFIREGMTRILFLLCLLPALCLPANAVAADEAAELRHLRADFLAAESALRGGDLDRYRTLLEGLRHYPLYPYLRYQYLLPRLRTTGEEEVTEFIRRYADSPLAARLQNAWLDGLARNGHWQTLLRHYAADSEDAELDCYRRWALHQSGDTTSALAGLERLWLVDHSQPSACDRVFSLWRNEGGLGAELIWRRFALAMSGNEIQLARYLARQLNGEYGKDAELWLRVHANPTLILNLPRDGRPVRGSILIHGIKRIARTDIDRAMAAWTDTVSTHHEFTPEETAEVRRSLGMTLALRGRKESLAWLAQVDTGGADTTLREWRARAAVSQQDWHAVLAAIYQMPEQEQATARWRYWQARALDALGQRQQADETFLGLALNRGYYGFLAADRLGQPYQMNHDPLDAAATRSVSPETYPGVARAHELFELDRLVDARREWYYTTRNMTDWQLQSAALLAQGWGWHDRAIVTMGRTSRLDDMELRFPVVHREEVLSEARSRGVDPALAFAVIRQESAFAVDARSPAGALGLMQLLPQTARKLAGYLRLPEPGRTDLLNVSTNLRLGIAHLRQLMDRYNNALVAVAAYNAGASRVDQWLPQDTVTGSDQWAETLPFVETRGYIQNVIYFASVYDTRLKLPPRKLSERMPAVMPLNTRLSREKPGPARRDERELKADADS
ncbi:MAG: transglycosylase SLT domain-containing protein [Gammaproteobacteria bacterium]|nr:transglycosylase SLT domain-containing protein [Gammaproteobacteria bacterium]